jgi:hypothetical protein
MMGIILTLLEVFWLRCGFVICSGDMKGDVSWLSYLAGIAQDIVTLLSLAQISTSSQHIPDSFFGTD